MPINDQINMSHNHIIIIIIMELHINTIFQQKTIPSFDFITVNAHKWSDEYESQPYNHRHHHRIEYKPHYMCFLLLETQNLFFGWHISSYGRTDWWCSQQKSLRLLSAFPLWFKLRNQTRRQSQSISVVLQRRWEE